MYGFVITRRNKKDSVHSSVTWAEDYIFNPATEMLTTYDQYANPLQEYDLSISEIVRIDVRNASMPQEGILQTYLGRCQNL